MEQLLITILIYSLGFGLILSLLTGLTLLLSRNTKPQLRYNILVTLLLLFTLSIIAVGFLKFSREKESVVALTSAPIEINHLGHTSFSISDPGFLDAGYRFLTGNSKTIAILWLFIVIIKSIKLGSNLLELHLLKTRQIFPVGEHWEKRINELARQIGLKKAVKVFQSGITQIPLVIGHFSPVILIPLGMITAIKPQEIEMMMLHELAHIRRMDFLVNILQHILELLFFFNPAVLWISSLIRKERENCCDEMVLQSSGSKQSYIQALLSFREYQLNVPAYAMAFARESNLVMRVKRLVHQKNTAMNSMEKGILLFAVILFCSFGLIKNTDAQPKDKEPFQEPAKKNTTVQTKTAKKPLPAQSKQPAKPKPSKKEKEAVSTSGKNGNINVNINSGANTNIQNLAVDLSDFNANVINLALDSTLSALSTTISDLSVNVNLDTTKKAKLKPLSGPLAKGDIRPDPKPVLRSQAKLLKDKSPSEDLIKELQKAGINTAGDKFSFHVTNKQLVVNGVRQPDDILRQVLSDFIKSPEDRIDFTYNRNGGYVSTSSDYHKK